MILGLLYGEGDFGKTLNITNMCGWDTDCNVGNVATIMGVRGGLEGIDYDKWRKPINDFLACSSVVGDMNIMDIPYGAVYIGKLAYALAGEKMPESWAEIAKERIESCHFEFPGSTHAIRVRVESEKEEALERAYEICNTEETAATGSHSLKISVPETEAGESVRVYKKTYYQPKDFYDDRYNPCFSPLLYPGQTLHGSAYIPVDSEDVYACLYVRELHTGKIYESEEQLLPKGSWVTMEFKIPALEGALLHEMGVRFKKTGRCAGRKAFIGFIDDLYADGKPEYSVEFAKEEVEQWTNKHWEISQFTKLKGLIFMEEESMHLSCADFAEAYTGRHDWEDYRAEFAFTPLLGEHHRVNVRVQGAIRSYAVGLLPEKKLAILKNDNGYKVLKEIPFEWENGKEYVIEVTVKGAWIQVCMEGKLLLETEDTEHPYLCGAIGVSLKDGSHDKYRRITVKVI